MVAMVTYIDSLVSIHCYRERIVDTLGVYLIHHIGVTRDKALAAALYEQAANAGYIPAMHECGLIYRYTGTSRPLFP
jgi:TPR repeat protein